MQRRVISFAGIVALLAAVMMPAVAGAITFDQEPFHQRWMRTDLPVAEGLVQRTWIWGPGPISAGMDEQYADSAGGSRRVQYFDKSRMEITHPDADAGELWYVTNGLLVMEMVTGQMQVGDNTFEEREPAVELVAGDQVASSDAPSYATVAGLMDEPARPVGDTIIERTGQDGVIVEDEVFANAGVTGAYLVPETDHVVASVFWDFMNSTGLVAEDGATFEGALFPNAFYATGLPITEAYWTTIPVSGELVDVLFQCFERRCMTYTPANEPGWQVEAGNVGQHYYAWRYGEAETQDVTIYLVAIGDDGASGTPFGCDDSLVPINRQIPAGADPVVGALEELLSIPGPDFGESGLSTAFYDWDVTVDSVTVESGLTTVEMSGEYAIAGTCEVPRVEEQLEQTVLAFPNIDAVEIFINGESLDDILSAQ